MQAKKNAASLESHLFFHRGETRIGANRIEDGVVFDVEDLAFAGVGGALEFGEGLVGVAEGGVKHRELVGRDEPPGSGGHAGESQARSRSVSAAGGAQADAEIRDWRRKGFRGP